ncbi:MAG: glutamate 5-kinase [Deltaproteobacteria bacterium]
MKQSEKKYKRVVVKIGGSLFYSAEGKLDFSVVNGIIDEISRLAKEGREIVVISSGAIALGMSVLNLDSRPRELANLQATAAIGQNELINVYRSSFKAQGHPAAQVLLTWDDFNDRKRYLNARNTLLALLEYRSIPVINENDTVSTDEIKFGDNDRLSALVAGLVCADLLIILSDVDGLLDKDGSVIRVVDKITFQIRALACPTDKKTCVGGMITKIDAAKIAIDSGMPCVIANGRRKDAISSAIKEPEKSGTLFVPKEGLAERERWIAFGSRPKGKIVVDEGAKKALFNKKSLLSVGVTGVEGDFESADIVGITDKNGSEFARGKAALSSRQLEKVKGKRSEKEVIHCDNIVILS